MGTFLDEINQTKLNQKDVSHLNRSIPSKDIKAIKNLPTKKSRGPDQLTAKLYQFFDSKLIPAFPKLFHKVEKNEHHQTHSRKLVLHLFQNQTMTQQNRNIVQSL
jgi:hypothetical protein